MAKFQHHVQLARQAKRVAVHAHESGSAAFGSSQIANVNRTYDYYNTVGSVESSNSRLCWIRGSTLSGDALEFDAPMAARENLAELARIFALVKLTEWVQ